MLFSANAIGCLNALLPIHRQWMQRGHTSRLLIQEGTPACKLWQEGGNDFHRRFEAVGSIDVVSQSDNLFELMRGDEEGFVAGLSPVTKLNLEVRLAQAARAAQIPLFAVEESPGGRNNPLWRKQHSLLENCSGIFWCLGAGMDWPNEYFVGGPLHLDRFRDVNWATEYDQGVRKTGLSKFRESVVIVFTHPSQESTPALLDIVRAAAWCIPRIHAGVRVIYMRHYRDVSDKAAAEKEVSVLAASLRIPCEDAEALGLTTTECLALAQQCGVLVGGFGIDVLCAPYLDIPSCLYLHPKMWGRTLWREKMLRNLELPCERDVLDEQSLQFRLMHLLGRNGGRLLHLNRMRQYYPQRDNHPADVVVRKLLELRGV